jgi:UDP-GlcNAc:undecaprenyl-phosphate GlcNAc-1-phosphate transferase
MILFWPMNLISTPFSPGIILALSFMLAALLSMLLVPVVSKFAAVNGLFDGQSIRRQSEASRKIHTGSIPRLGGVAMVVAFLGAISILPASLPYQGVLLGSIAVFVCGVIDDFTPIPAKFRLLIQILAAGFAIYHDQLALDHITLTKTFTPSLPAPLSLIFSTFLIVGAINAINLIDGLDGLAAGVVLIGVSLISFADYVATQNASVILTFALPMIGAIFGFLRYNTHPASIFMGDGGSNWLGFMSGSLLLIALRPSPITHLSAPLISIILTFAIPIIDTAVVMMRRIREKRSPFSADKNHFHHTLLRIGLTHSQSVMTIYFMAFAFGVLGIFPAIFPKYDFPWVPYAAAILLLLVVPAAAKLDDDAVSAAVTAHRRASLKPMSLKISSAIRHWENINRYLLFAILMLGPALSGQVPREFATWAAVAGAIIILSAFIPYTKRGAVFFDSFTICAAAVVILIVNNLNPMTIAWEGRPYSIHSAYNSLFILLFISSLMLFLATARRRSFIFTPSDFLLLAFPLAILLLPQEWQSQYKLDLISLRSLVIFMTIRVLYRRRPKHIGNLKLACMIALVWVYLVAAHGVRVVY